MRILFDSFEEWRQACEISKQPLYQPVLDYEIDQKDV